MMGISDFSPQEAESNYIFHASRWWPESDSLVNSVRRRFVEVCVADPDIRFEGGFAPGKDAMALPEHLLAQRYSARDYLSRTARSALVFNAPAVHGCFGWKLPEYLALGKPIISLPLSHELPAPLVHGEHIHYVPDADSLALAVRELMSDKAYRDHLGKGSRDYWEHHLTPELVVRRMVAHAEKLVSERDPRTLLPPPPPRTTRF